MGDHLRHVHVVEPKRAYRPGQAEVVEGSAGFLAEGLVGFAEGPVGGSTEGPVEAVGPQGQAGVAGLEDVVLVGSAAYQVGGPIEFLNSSPVGNLVEDFAEDPVEDLVENLVEAAETPGLEADLAYLEARRVVTGTSSSHDPPVPGAKIGPVLHQTGIAGALEVDTDPWQNHSRAMSGKTLVAASV